MTQPGDELMTLKPDCYECKYRSELAGSSHSKCCHPLVVRVTYDSLGEMLGVFDPVGMMALNVKCNVHGIIYGWFNWPWNYDPVWLESCDGFVSQLETNIAARDCIEASPTKLGGIPVLRGTRFSVAQLFAELADGDSVEEIADNFELDANQIGKLLHALSMYLDRSSFK